jgi:hypothetical protein
VEECSWQRKLPQPGQKLPPPQPLFTKLDEKLVDEETSRLGQAYP